jgi:hypothetical protein
MGRALTGVGIALVLLIGGLGLAVFVTRDEDYVQVDNLLAERLTRAIALAESETGGTVDLATLAPFAWDRVLLVEHGTSAAEISRRIGHEWRGRIGFQTGDLFLFVLGDRVVRFADYRGDGRFDGFRRPFAELPRDRAVLRVRRLVITPARGTASSARAPTAPPPPTRGRA